MEHKASLIVPLLGLQGVEYPSLREVGQFRLAEAKPDWLRARRRDFDIDSRASLAQIQQQGVEHHEIPAPPPADHRLGFRRLMPRKSAALGRGGARLLDRLSGRSNGLVGVKSKKSQQVAGKPGAKVGPAGRLVEPEPPIADRDASRRMVFVKAMWIVGHCQFHSVFPCSMLCHNRLREARRTKNKTKLFKSDHGRAYGILSRSDEKPARRCEFASMMWREVDGRGSLGRIAKFA